MEERKQSRAKHLSQGLTAPYDSIICLWLPVEPTLKAKNPSCSCAGKMSNHFSGEIENPSGKESLQYRSSGSEVPSIRKCFHPSKCNPKDGPWTRHHSFRPLVNELVTDSLERKREEKQGAITWQGGWVVTDWDCTASPLRGCGMKTDQETLVLQPTVSSAFPSMPYLRS